MQSAQIRPPQTEPEPIPADILAEIFVHTLAGEPTVFPPNPLQPPWSLGRVCSRWRQVALTQPRLWGKFLFSTDNIVPDALAYAQAMLSRCSPLSISLIGNDDSRGVEAVQKLVVPYLHSISELYLCIPRSGYTVLFRSPPEASVPASTMTEDSVDTHVSPLVNTIFHTAECLRKLHFSLLGELLGDILMHLGIPWHQLTDIELPIGDLDVTKLCYILSQCSSLERFCASLPHDYVDSEPDSIHSRCDILKRSLPRLRYLKFCGNITGLLPFILGPHQHLTHLDLLKASNVTPVDAYCILEHNTQLKVFFCEVWLFFSDHVSERRIISRCLTELQLSVWDPRIFGTFLAPALTKLNIHCSGGRGTESILTMIKDSGCALTTFIQTGYYSPSFDETFALMPTLVEFRGMNSRSVIRADALARIAQGVLLPRLEVLICRVGAPMAFVDVAEARLKAMRQGEPGIGILREASAITAAGQCEAAARLKELNEEYGVSFELIKQPGN